MEAFVEPGRPDAGRASVQVIPCHISLIYRLEGDIARILHRLDSIEQSLSMRSQKLHRGAPADITPPESNYEFRLGNRTNSARDDLHTEIPAETDAISVRRKSLLDEPSPDLSSKTTSLIHEPSICLCRLFAARTEIAECPVPIDPSRSTSSDYAGRD